MNTESLLRVEAVVARTGLSRSAVYERARTGSFPRPIKIEGSRICAWPASEIDAWIHKQIALARAAQTGTAA